MKLTLDCAALFALALLFFVPRLAEVPMDTATITIGAPRPAAVQTLADFPTKADATKSGATKSGATSSDAAQLDAAKPTDGGQSSPATSATPSASDAPSASAAPSAPPRDCIDADGKKFTWAYPNVPAGTVRCDPDETHPH
jgi:hypothetical protein